MTARSSGRAAHPGWHQQQHQQQQVREAGECWGALLGKGSVLGYVLFPVQVYDALPACPAGHTRLPGGIHCSACHQLQLLGHARLWQEQQQQQQGKQQQQQQAQQCCGLQ